MRWQGAHHVAVKSTTSSLSAASACTDSQSSMSSSSRTPPRRRNTALAASTQPLRDGAGRTAATCELGVEPPAASAAGPLAALATTALAPRARCGVAAGLVLYLAFQAWHLTELWARHEAVTCTPHTDTSKVRTRCDDYGAVHLVWASVYFGILPGLLLYLHSTYRNTQ